MSVTAIRITDITEDGYIGAEKFDKDGNVMIFCKSGDRESVTVVVDGRELLKDLIALMEGEE